MSADRVPNLTKTAPNETEDLNAIQRDLETIIHETLPPARAEAYVARLRHLLKEIRGTTFSLQVVPSNVSVSEPEASEGTAATSEGPS